MGSFVSFSKRGPTVAAHDYGDSHSMVSFVDGIIRPEDSISMVGVNRPPTVVGGAPTAAAAPPSAIDGSRPLRAAGRLPPLMGSAGGLASPPRGPRPRGTSLLIKLPDPADGTFHRVRCIPEDGWAALCSALRSRLPASREQLRAVVYPDDDADLIAIDSDESLLEAACQAWRGKADRLTVTAVMGGMQLTSPTKSEQLANAQCAEPTSSADAEPTARGGRDVGGHGGHDPSRGGAGYSVQGAGAPADSALLPTQNMSAVSSFLGGLLAASSLAVGAGLVIAAKAAQR